MSLIDTIHRICEAAFNGAYPELSKIECAISVTKSTKEAFGHYQCNSAMALAKDLKQKPRDIAQKVVDELKVHNKKNPVFSKVDIAGPGFINLSLLPEYLSHMLTKMLTDKRLNVPQIQDDKRIVIDFSSPNIAKEMHVGHLRSTIIGDSLANVLAFLGYDVLRLNHIGDWGTSFGMLIAYLKANYSEVYQGNQPASLTDLVSWYKAAKKCFDEDEAFKKQAQLEVVALQNGEPDVYRAWEIICAISRVAYQEIYDLLEISLIERGESFYNPKLVPLVASLEEKGLIRVSDGAKCIFLEGFVNREGQPLPFIIQKSDGGFNYATTDMAALKHRIVEEKADRIIYVTDNGQVEHFKMLFLAAKKATFFDEEKVLVEHVPFGLVLNKAGKKFKTRSGETEKLIDLLYTAIAKAKQILLDRELGFSEAQINHAAKVLGIGAVKYADLSTDRINDYTFSHEKMLRFEGNTAAFILYSYVRTRSILRRAGVESQSVNDTPMILSHKAEINLAVKLCQFHETLQNVAVDLMPHRLTDYLFVLAERFNAFFRDCQVLGDKNQDSRLKLCILTGNMLKIGLNLLGINVLEKM